MEILAVDEDISVRKKMESLIAKIESGGVNIRLAKGTEEALQIMKEDCCDVVFTEILFHGQPEGLEFARALKQINPRVNIIFTTDCPDHMMEAFLLRVSGYVMKPVTEDKIRRELEDLRFPVKMAADKRLRVYCFGNFDLFVDGNPVRFGYSRTKEMFAYLVDRKGARVTGNELCAVLWEDAYRGASTKAYLRNLYADLKKTFHRLHVDDVLFKDWGIYAVRPEKFWCDRYEFEKGNRAVIDSFHKEYMMQYSWAEFSVGFIKNNKIQ